MCCWGYGELSKESHGKGRLWEQLCCWVMVGRELGVSVPRKQMGKKILSRKDAKSTEIALQIPLSVRCLVLSIKSPPNTRLFPACIPQNITAKLQTGSWGGGGAMEWLRGCVDLSEQMGYWLRSGLISFWDRGRTSPSSRGSKTVAFLQPWAQQSWGRRGREKRAAVRWAKENLFIWKARLTFQNCCGECAVASAPSFIKLYVFMWIYLFMYLTSLARDCLCHCAHPVCAGRETRCCCHMLPAASIQASQPFLVCLFVMGHVQQLAAQTSDCFLLFCFFFHILFIFPTCIRCLQGFLLWAVKRALGLKCLMVVTPWIFYASVCLSNFVYESGIDEAGREGWVMWTKLHPSHGRPWIPLRNSPGRSS